MITIDLRKKNKSENTDIIIKIPMNKKSDWSSNNILGNTKCYNTSDLQPRHANSGSSESDLVSDKIKEAVIIYHNSSTTTIIYNTCLTTSCRLSKNH